jgi:hypothetical protein
LISKTRHLPSGRSTWAKAEARLTVIWQAAILDLSAATTTTTLEGVRPLVGGSSHLQGVTRDRPIISLFQKTCTNETKAKCTCQKKIRTKVHNMQRAIPNLP